MWDYIWEKFSPSKSEFKEIVFPKMDLPHLGRWGQSFDEVYTYSTLGGELKPIRAYKLDSYFVDVEDLRNPEEEGYILEISNELEEIILDYLSDWNTLEDKIDKETKDFFNLKYSEPEIMKDKLVSNFILDNYFKIRRVIVRENDLVLDCENVCDEEHGLSILINDNEVKVNTADLI